MKAWCRYLVCALCGMSVLGGSPDALAADQPRWSMSMLLGGHMPALDGLNDGLYGSSLKGDATVLVREGGAGGGATDGEDVDQNETALEEFEFRNPVPKVGLAALSGLEFQWHPNSRHAFFFGLGSMEKTSINKVEATLPLQSYYANNRVLSERRDRISYTSYTLGWRFNFWDRKKYRFYTRLAVNEVFDIDFREDFVFLFVNTPIEDLIGVRRNMVIEAQTSSLLMGQIGAGGEWFLRDWLSLGVEGGFVVGERKFTLRDVKYRQDFLSGDDINLNGLTARRLADGTLGYLRHDTTPDQLKQASTRLDYYEPLELSFDGWQIIFRVNFYY